MNRLFLETGFLLEATSPMKFDAYYVSLLSEQYRKAGIPQLKALSEGYKSNRAAAKSGTYSSMVFVAKQK
jgi:hypothetical protein